MTITTILMMIERMVREYIYEQQGYKTRKYSAKFIHVIKMYI